MRRSILIPALAVLLIAVGVLAVVLASRDDPDHALQAALSTTCDPSLTRYFDVTLDLDGEISLFRYDGTDFHMTTSTPNGLYEEIRKGTTVYTRRSADDDWTTRTETSSFIGICGPVLSTSSTRSTETVDPSYAYAGLNFNFMNTVTLDGETVRHYVSDPFDSSTSDKNSAYDGSTEELWINSSNHIVKAKRNLVINITHFGGISSTPTMTFQLSGFGEVNTITAPEGVTPPEPMP